MSHAINTQDTNPAIHLIALPVTEPKIPIRRDWRRALRAMKIMKEDPSRTDQVFELSVALDGGDSERVFQGMLTEPGGADLLRDAPDLPALLCDSKALRRMPSGSLGRAYLELMTRNGFAAESLQQLSTKVKEFKEIFPGAARIWWSARMAVVHDLMHVVTGYGQDAAGEIALTAFTDGVHGRRFKMMVNRFALLGSVMSTPPGSILRLIRYLWSARRRGARSRVSFSFRWEEVLTHPLEDVRWQLGIEDFETAHPHGELCSATGGEYMLKPVDVGA